MQPPMKVYQCPRCHLNTVQRFYGPCRACREQLERWAKARVKVGEVIRNAKSAQSDNESV